MSYLIFTPHMQGTYPYVLLTNTLRVNEIEEAFATIKQSLLCLSIAQNPVVKPTVTSLREHFTSEILPTLQEFGAEYLLITDAKYFKALVKVAKVSDTLGFIYDSTYTNAKLVYCPSVEQIFYNPTEIRAKIDAAIQAVVTHDNGTYVPPGEGVLKHTVYPQTLEEIADALESIKYKTLTIDIETFSLKHYDSGIGSIAFATDQHSGVSFLVDPSSTERNEPVRQLLKKFFEEYTDTAIYHNASFDIYILVYQLFMEGLRDTKGLLYGLEILTRKFHCTKIITYLAVNSCSRNSLSLKDQAREFAGNWGMGEDIEDIRNIPSDKLLEYNLTDAVATWFVKDKYWDKMISDQQLDVYTQIFRPAIIDVIQMQLTGMPVDANQVQAVKLQLRLLYDSALERLMVNPVIAEFTEQLNVQWVEKRNTELKVKRVTRADANEVFNFNSPVQLQQLLYTFIGLPVISYTDTKQPSADSDTLEALQSHTAEKYVLDVLDCLLALKSVDKILGTFIPALEKAVLAEDGWHYLYGSFTLGGTVSGRLSSKEPNLTNLPSGSQWGKLVKSCFRAPPGKLLIGIDADSLEDRISALTSKDPNKLKIYSDGYDGHCLRTYAYADGTEPWYDKVRQAEPSEETFKVTIGEDTYYLKGTDAVMDETGQVTTVAELAILLHSQKA